jgi:hypothetical protein
MESKPYLPPISALYNRLTYPPDSSSHSRQQDFYFGTDFLLRRHDYRVEASGGFAAAKYVFEPVTVQSITPPTKRAAYMRDPRLVRDP